MITNGKVVAPTRFEAVIWKGVAVGTAVVTIPEMTPLVDEIERPEGKEAAENVIG